MRVKGGVKLPGMKGLWRKPDEVSVNEAGVPTYTWNFGFDGVRLVKPIKIQPRMSPAPQPPRES